MKNPKHCPSLKFRNLDEEWDGAPGCAIRHAGRIQKRGTPRRRVDSDHSHRSDWNDALCLG